MLCQSHIIKYCFIVSFFALWWVVYLQVKCLLSDIDNMFQFTQGIDYDSAARILEYLHYEKLSADEEI